MKKVFDQRFKKGAIKDDDVNRAMHPLAYISHKPTEHESDLVNGDIGDVSYSTIYEKGFRIVVYIED